MNLKSEKLRSNESHSCLVQEGHALLDKLQTQTCHGITETHLADLSSQEDLDGSDKNFIAFVKE